MDSIEKIQDRIENALPGKLVLSLRQDWKAIADGRNVTKLDEVLFWQAAQKAFTEGQIDALSNAISIVDKKLKKEHTNA